MEVEYQVLNTGSHVLVVKKTGSPAILQTVELKIREGEALNFQYGFQCLRSPSAATYAVVARKNAREKGVFPPERAWDLDTQKYRLVPAKDPKVIECHWNPDGDGDYNFK